jgi:spore coat polysaccharide biosynthesis protein SpsF
MDAEVFKFSVLQEAWEEAKAQLQREHVTPFIWQQPQRYKLGHVVSPVDYSDWRLTLDHKEDFDFISKIYEALYPTNPHFSLADVIQLVNTRLSQERNNAVHIGHEGYKEFWHGNAE